MKIAVQTADYTKYAEGNTDGERGRLDRSRWRPAIGPAALD